MDNSVEKFTITCNLKGQVLPFVVYIGNPKNGVHPVYYQDFWLAETYGSGIPNKIKESLRKLHKLSRDNALSFLELYRYALTVVKGNKFGDK